MKNLRIGGCVVMLIGILIYFITGENFETLAGAIAGAGFGLLIYSFLGKSIKGY